MAKKEKQHLVTGITSTLKINNQASNVLTQDEVDKQKKEILAVVNEALTLFKTNLANGTVRMESSLDFERMMKCYLVLTGQPDTIVARANEETSASLTMSKVEDILDENDKDVMAMFEKLYAGYNKKNDIEE